MAQHHFGEDPQAIPAATTIRKAFIRAFNSGAHTGDVQLVGSHPTLLTGVRFATDIPAAECDIGRECLVLFLQPHDPTDALVLTVQGAVPGIPGAALEHAPIGALYPGVLSTGVKPPQVPYRGATFTIDKLYVRVTGKAQGQAITVNIRRNGVSMGTVTIAANASTGETDVDVEVSTGDYFDIEITQVGTPPNEGSDLVWLLVP